MNIKVAKQNYFLINNKERIKFVSLDVTKEEEVISKVKLFNNEYNGIDILVNNAGISPKYKGKALRIDKLDLNEWEQVLNVNLTGAFLCTREVIKKMVTNNWGRIINIVSQSARTSASIAGVHYSASKTGLVGLSRTIAKQFGEYNITSNCIAPGRIETEMTRAVSDKINNEFLNNIPIKRMGNGDEVGELVKFLASEKAGYITGATIDINGGSFIG